MQQNEDSSVTFSPIVMAVYLVASQLEEDLHLLNQCVKELLQTMNLPDSFALICMLFTFDKYKLHCIL